MRIDILVIELSICNIFINITFSLYRAFIHVSTAFSQAVNSTVGQEVKEIFGETPVSPEALIQFVETLDDTKLDEITPA